MIMDKTKRCTFYGMREIIDVDFCDKVRKTLTRLAEENDSLEFLFHITGASYEVFLMETLALRTQYPDKDISLVYISEINPECSSGVNPLGTYFYRRYSLTTPFSFYDKIFFAPEYKMQKYDGRRDFMRVFHHTQSWLVEQCDVLIAYEYPELFSSEATYLKRYSKKVKEVISLTNEETSERIVSYITELEDKHKTIMDELLSGMSVAEIAKRRKVTNTAINTKIDRMTRIIKDKLRRDYRISLGNAERNPKTKCAVCGFDKNSVQYIHDIVVLIKYLESNIGVNEYFIPYNLCFNELIGPLIHMSKENSDKINLVAVVPENDTKGTTFYCPPYSRILSISNLIDRDFYKNLISECAYLICDLSAVEDKDALKEFCCTAGTTLIDVSLLSGQIRKSYFGEENECIE